MAPLLAFVDIFVESAHMDEVVQALAKLDNIEELYEVTGEFDIVTLVLADDIEEFRDVLKNKIMKTLLSQWEPASPDTAQRLSHSDTGSLYGHNSWAATRTIHH